MAGSGARGHVGAVSCSGAVGEGAVGGLIPGHPAAFPFGIKILLEDGDHFLSCYKKLCSIFIYREKSNLNFFFFLVCFPRLHHPAVQRI